MPGPGVTTRPCRAGSAKRLPLFTPRVDFAPLWWTDGKPNPEAAPVIKRLQHAADDGLDVKAVPRTFAAASDEDIAAADIALTDAVVSYGRQASGSRVDPHAISKLIGETPEVADPAIILALVATAGGSAGDELQKFNPPQKAYASLRDKLRQLRHGRAPAAHDAAIPAGPVSARGNARSARAAHSRAAER